MTEHEDWARRQLHRIGGESLPVGGTITADKVIARHHRQRRARVAWLGLAAAITLAVSIPAALGATGQAPANRDGVSAASGSVRTISAPTELPTPAKPSPPAHPGSIGTRSGPARAEIGVAYPFDLRAHCGIRSVSFAGRSWTAVHPAAEPRRLPNSTGITEYTGYVAGTMTLVQPDLLRFTLTDRNVAGTGTSFDFIPAPGPAARCD